MPEIPSLEPLPFEDALQRILAIPYVPDDELTPLTEACGRTLAAPTRATFDLPRFTQSAMDGIALRAIDTRNASPETPVKLPIVGESAAGKPFYGTLVPGLVLRISTGAPLPMILDAVVPVERVKFRSDHVELTEPAVPGQFIRRRGEDVEAGAELLPAATTLGPAQVAYLAAFNLPNVTTYVPPRVGILTSGDEVKLLGAKLLETQIVGSSLYYLEGELRACGCEPRIFGVSPDDPAKFRVMLSEALMWSDMVITTAGVSVGQHDVVGSVLKEMGAKILFWRVAVRPGKPMLVATIGGKVLFGLPGNPVSTICNTEIFIKPFLRKAFGSKNPVRLPEKQRLGAECARDPHRLFFIYAKREMKGGRPMVLPFAKQSSANIANPALADGLIVAPPGPAPIHVGEIVDWLPMKPGL